MVTRSYGWSATSATAWRSSGLRSPRVLAARVRVDVDVEDVTPPVRGDGVGHLQPVVGFRRLQHGSPHRTLGRTVGPRAVLIRVSIRKVPGVRRRRAKRSSVQYGP